MSDIRDLVDRAKKQYCKLHIFAKRPTTEIFLYTEDGTMLPGNNGKSRQAGIGTCRMQLVYGVYQVQFGSKGEMFEFELLDDMLLREE